VLPKDKSHDIIFKIAEIAKFRETFRKFELCKAKNLKMELGFKRQNTNDS
jgi:hypothetical protein